MLHRDLRLPPRTPRLLHLDVDAFLASVEQALHPELRGRPVVVGGLPSSRNLVMSCSYESRPFGVRPGLSLREAARLCPGAVFRYGDSQAAGRLREAIARVLLDFTPDVEITSIDDFLVDLTGTARALGSAFEVATRIQRRVRDELHLPLTIGVGTNVLFARLAGKLGKPGGVAELLPGHEQAFLDGLPLHHLPGVGHRIGAQLERFGLRTVGELRRLVPRELLFQSFGRNGLLIHERAHGRDERRVEASVEVAPDNRLRHRPPKSLRRDSTFEPEEGRPEQIEAMLSWLVERAAWRLRAHGLVCGNLGVRLIHVATGLESSGTDGGPHRRGPARPAERTRRMEAPTDSTDVLWRTARELLLEFPRRRALVKRIGLSLTNLRSSSGWQRQLFDTLPGQSCSARGIDNGEGPAERRATSPHSDQQTPSRSSRSDRQRELDTTIDHLREKLGFGRILRGSSLPLRETHPLGPDGFRLRTPSLNQ